MNRGLLFAGIVILGLTFAVYFMPTGENSVTLVQSMGLCISDIDEASKVFGEDAQQICPKISYMAFAAHSMLIVGAGLVIMGVFLHRFKKPNRY